MEKLNTIIVLVAVAVGYWYFVKDNSSSSPSVSDGSSKPPPQIRLPNGLIQGERREKYVAFEGVPYAAPPIGENRFEPPKPFMDKWEGVWDATQPRSMCIQWYHFFFDRENKVQGNEDCLYLNVYMPHGKFKKPLPVLVFIHGGAFMFGDGDFYLPDHLINMPMVYVSFNYRLGPMGFLTTEDEVVPGNMGMKDQVMALQWVNDNIAAFGGNPKRIHLSGFSAGGASVHLHYFSPLSRNLFKTGISHSGTALNPWVYMEHPKEKSQRLATLVGCPDEDPTEMINCLKQKPAEDIVATMKHFQGFLYNPFSPFALVVEEEREGSFITRSPYAAIRDGQFKHEPWIVSATEAEGLYPAGEFLMKEGYLEEIEAHWDVYARYILDYNYSVPDIFLEPITRMSKEKYLGAPDAVINRDSFNNLTQMISDRLFNMGVLEGGRLHALKADNYMYRFFYKSSVTIPTTEVDVYGRLDELGVPHGADVFLIYQPRHQNYELNADDIRMREKLVQMYFTFIRGEHPRLGDFKMINLKEEPTLTMIESPDVIRMDDNPFAEVIFWTELWLARA